MKGMHVSALKSGQALLDYISANGTPDLILLDIKMPGMDGFETLKRLREQEAGKPQVPVVFLTADENEESEMTGLSLGAMDFIKKPFIPDVPALRVRHIIDLSHLQQDLSRGIACRYGYSTQRQKALYMTALLHDVGKIGIPDAIINKPAKLTDDEYAVIKTHTVMGAKILNNINEMPGLVTGARWHHERYDGKGYPDGLARSEIPEEARIIAVADAYDAMTSRRSYREILPQEHVRSEVVGGRGTQFDPVFADIMLSMIDEDSDYNMREI